MNTISINQITRYKREIVIEVSLDSVSRLTVLNANAIKQQLMDFVTSQGAVVHLNLKGVRFIDSAGFECLNQVSIIARRYHSALKLINVETELFELIDLVKEFGVFEIDSVMPSSIISKVA